MTRDGLPVSRCGFGNSPGHRPHDFAITGEWPTAGPHRHCPGGPAVVEDSPMPAVEDRDPDATVYGNTERGRRLVEQLHSLGMLLARRPDLAGVGVAARHELAVGAA